MKINYTFKTLTPSYFDQSTWNDSLIWCPSQCEKYFSYKNRDYVIYLRWRNSDPWTGYVIDVDKSDGEWKEWYPLNFSYPWRDTDNLDTIKEDAINQVIKFLIQTNTNT